MLRPLDWLVLGVYFALLVTTGIVLSRRKPRGATDYFLADRRMPAWAVAISLLATVQSAATFVGVPEQGYGGDLRYLSTSIGAVIAAVILFKLFIPAYYRLGVATPYQLLSTRFTPGAMQAASGTYMMGRILASGARLYMGALPFSLAVFGDARLEHIAMVTAGFVVFGILYTFAGGVRSVIWTDVLQVTVYIGAALAIIAVLLAKIPADTGQIWNALAHPPTGESKLTVFRVGANPTLPGWGFDPAERFTLLTVVFGFMLINLGALGTDQDLTQRTLTCDSPRRAGWSVVGGTLIGIPATVIFSVIGLLLYIYYQRPDVMGEAHAVVPVADSTEAFISFSLTQMPAGMAGLMIAGMLAAGPAGLNASLNSMASSFLNDVYRPVLKGRSERHYLLVGRLAVVGWGVILGSSAVLCSVWRSQSGGQTLIDFALSVMTFAYAGLLGVFFTALLTRRGNGISAIAALGAGFITVLLFQPFIWMWWTGQTEWTAANLAPLKIAYPWHLLIGTLVATGVCCLGRPAPKSADA
jgi:SSS family solute:Na+ symporter